MYHPNTNQPTAGVVSYYCLCQTATGERKTYKKSCSAFRTRTTTSTLKLCTQNVGYFFLACALFHRTNRVKWACKLYAHEESVEERENQDNTKTHRLLPPHNVLDTFCFPTLSHPFCERPSSDAASSHHSRALPLPPPSPGLHSLRCKEIQPEALSDPTYLVQQEYKQTPYKSRLWALPSSRGASPLIKFEINRTDPIDL